MGAQNLFILKICGTKICGYSGTQKIVGTQICWYSYSFMLFSISFGQSGESSMRLIACSTSGRPENAKIFIPELMSAIGQENLSSGFLTRSDTNRTMQPQKIDRNMELRI